MIDLERYLNDIKFTSVVDELEPLNIADCYSVTQIFVSSVIKDSIEVNYDFHYDKSSKRVIDSMDINVYRDSDHVYKEALFMGLGSDEALKEYYNSKNIDKKIEIYKQWQNKGFAKKTMKFALKELRCAAGDYLVAKLNIITLKLGGNLNEKM